MPTPEELQAMLATPMEEAEGPPPDDAALQAELSQPMPTEAPTAVVPEAPQPSYSEDGRVYVVSKYGDLGTVREDELPSLGLQGFTLAAPEQVASQIEEEKFSTTGQQIATGAEGFAQGVTVGGYGALASAVDDEYGEDMRKRAQYNPGTALAGEVVGTVPLPFYRVVPGS